MLHLCLDSTIYSIERGKSADERINLPDEMEFVQQMLNKTATKAKTEP